MAAQPRLEAERDDVSRYTESLFTVPLFPPSADEWASDAPAA